MRCSYSSYINLSRVCSVIGIFYYRNYLFAYAFNRPTVCVRGAWTLPRSRENLKREKKLVTRAESHLLGERCVGWHIYEILLTNFTPEIIAVIVPVSRFYYWFVGLQFEPNRMVHQDGLP